MTTQDLITRYSAGHLDRRGFVTRLTALGVSAGAAVAYAQAFAPSAAAQRVPTRVQQADEYGTAVEFESDAEAITTVSTVDQAHSDLLTTGLSQFTEDEFAPFDVNGLNTAELLNQMAEHVTEHLDALQQALARAASNPVAAAIQIPEMASADEFITKLGDLTNLLASLYAAAVPAVESDELRQDLANAALVKGRHASYLNLIRGLPPFEQAFETPADIDNLLAEIEEILNG
jgi:hypothetical protein